MDGPTQSHFRRFDLLHPELNISVAVFPHGSNGGLWKQIEETSRRAGLEPQYVWANDPRGEQFATRILSIDPWNERWTEMPAGYAGSTGHTTYGALCWKIPKKPSHLEISYVSWRFYETSDFSTSLVVRMVPPLYGTPQELADLTAAATRVTSQVRA